MRSKILLILLAFFLVVPSCSKNSYKKKAKRYNKHLNDHPDRSKENLKHMKKKKN